MNAIGNFLLRRIDREGKYEFANVSRKQTRLLTDSTVKYLRHKNPEMVGESEKSGEFLFLKYLLVLGGRVRPARKVVDKKTGGGSDGK